MSSPQSRRTRQAWGHIDWLLNPFRRREIAEIYDLMADDVLTERGLYLNLGYWRSAEDLDAASVALAHLVAETAHMGPGDTVLDVGFGYAEQDLLWAQAYRPERIIGLNITAAQVAAARQRVAEQGLEARIELHEGSATAMPLADASVDKVIALECAFHFRSREDFFQEAQRVLRPGGILVLADIVPQPAADGRLRRLWQRLDWRLVASKFLIPRENAYPRTAYRERLAAAGFEHVEVESIRDEVYAPLHRWLAANPQAVLRLHPAARWAARLTLRLSPEVVYAGLDYVLASAVKPLPAQD